MSPTSQPQADSTTGGAETTMSGMYVKLDGESGETQLLLA